MLASQLLESRLLGVLCALAWGVNLIAANNSFSASVMYDNLLFLWWMAALLLYLRARRKPGAAAWAGSLVCFILSTRSKEVGVRLPLLLLAYELALIDWKAHEGG